MWPKWYNPRCYDWRVTLDRVCDFYKVQPEDIFSRRRNAHFIDARWTLAKALRTKGHLSLPRIGQIVQRDHTSVLHACREFDYRAKYRPHMVEALHKALHG